MNTDIKQAMHVGAGKSFGTAEANENERRWNDDKIDRKNQDPTNHYDRTRMKLNFEIGPDGKIHPLVIRRNRLKSVCKNGWTNWVGSRSRRTAKSNRTVALSLSSEETMTGRLKWLSGISPSIWRKVRTTATCTVARKSRIGRKMSMTGVSKYTGRRTLSGFRYILMRAVRIFMPWLFLLVFAPKADGSV